MKRLVLKAIAAAITLAAFTSASAQEVTLKFATANPKGHPIVLGMEKFAEIVQAKSGGKIKVGIYPSSSLGTDAAVVASMQGGTVEMASLNSGILASQVKDFEVFDFPFMFANGKEADAVVDGPFGKMMHAKLEAKGLVGLGYWELGFRQITNSKRPLTKVEDIAGLKLRVIPNAINVDWVKALGANPTPLAFAEVFAALEQGAIDGQENPVTVIAANKFYEVQKYVTLTNHQYNPQSILVSKKFWDGLSAGDKKILSDAATESAPYQRAQSRDLATKGLEDMRKGGMQISELSAAELAKFREKMKPVVDKHGAASADTVAQLQNELAKLRK